MALKPTIYKCNLQISDSDREHYAQAGLTLARHPSETAERLMARLLAYALNHEEDLEFTRGLSSSEEPEIWLHTADGRIEHWIELGQPEETRLRKAQSRAEKISVYAYSQSTPTWWQKAGAAIDALSKVEVWVLPWAELSMLAAAMSRNATMSVSASGGHVYVEVEGTTADFEPARLTTNR